MDAAAVDSTPVKRYPFWINRNFAFLWSGQAISYVGDFVFDTTLILWVAVKLGNGQSWAPLAVSAVLVCTFAPVLLIGPIAGVFVDRWDKRKTMLAMDAIRACVIGLLLLTTYLPLSTGARLALIYLTVVLVIACQQFFGPSRMALISDVVDPEVRGRASGLFQITMSLATIIGPPLAAPLLFFAGVQVALLVNALSFVVSFIAIWSVKAPPATRSVAPGARGDAWGELIAGLRFFARNRVLVTLLIATVVAMLGAGALNALDVFFVTQNLHTSAKLYGFVSAAFGSGALIGAIGASAMASKIAPARMFWAALLLTSTGLLAYSRMTSLIPALVVIFLVGIPVAAVNVAVMPLILQVTPKEMIGRVTSVLMPAISLASIASIVLAGVLVSTWMRDFHATLLGITFGPVDTVLLGTGILGLAAGVYAYFGLRNVDASVAEVPAPVMSEVG